MRGKETFWGETNRRNAQKKKKEALLRGRRCLKKSAQKTETVTGQNRIVVVEKRTSPYQQPAPIETHKSLAEGNHRETPGKGKKPGKKIEKCGKSQP